MNKKGDLEIIVSERDNQRIEIQLATYLTEYKQSLAFAESCTGGYLSHLITLLPGCSDYFKGGIVAYSNQIKRDILQVSEEVLLREGAVSEATVEQMAKQTRFLFQSDYAVAVSGIAGPGGGTPEKPIGTVWISIAQKEKITSQLFQFGNIDRNLIIRKTAIYTLHILNQIIEKQHY